MKKCSVLNYVPDSFYTNLRCLNRKWRYQNYSKWVVFKNSSNLTLLFYKKLIFIGWYFPRYKIQVLAVWRQHHRGGWILLVCNFSESLNNLYLFYALELSESYKHLNTILTQISQCYKLSDKNSLMQDVKINAEPTCVSYFWFVCKVYFVCLVYIESFVDLFFVIKEQNGEMIFFINLILHLS